MKYYVKLNVYKKQKFLDFSVIKKKSVFDGVMGIVKKSFTNSIVIF